MKLGWSQQVVVTHCGLPAQPGVPAHGAFGLPQPRHAAWSHCSPGSMTPLPHGGSVVVVGVVLAQVAGCGLHRRMSLSMSCRVGLVLETACAVIVVVPFFLPFFFKGTVAVKVWQAES